MRNKNCLITTILIFGVLFNIGVASAKDDVSQDRLQELTTYEERAVSDPNNPEVWSKIGKLKFQLEDWDGAREAYEKSEKLCDKHYESHKIIFASALKELGRILQQKEDFDRAKEYHLLSLDAYDGLGDKAGMAENLVYLGDMSRMEFQFEDSERYHRRALFLYRELGDQENIAKQLYYIGSVLSISVKTNYLISDEQKRRITVESEKYYLKALVIFEKLEMKGGLAATLRKIGGTSYSKGELSRAKKYFERALSMYIELGNERRVREIKKALQRIESEINK